MERARDNAIAEFTTRLQSSPYVIISGDTPHQKRTGELAQRLQTEGYEVHRCRGVWNGEVELSLLVFSRVPESFQGQAKNLCITDRAGQLALEYDQQAYIQSRGVRVGAGTYLQPTTPWDDATPLHKFPSILGHSTHSDVFTDVSYTPLGQQSSFLIRFRLVEA